MYIKLNSGRIGREFGTMSKHETIEELSEKVLKLTKYGMREEVLEGFGYIFSWSNAARKWWVSHIVHKRGETIKLDANQFVGYISIQDSEDICKQLPELPLYWNSFEANYKKG